MLFLLPMLSLLLALEEACLLRETVQMSPPSDRPDVLGSYLHPQVFFNSILQRLLTSRIGYTIIHVRRVTPIG